MTDAASEGGPGKAIVSRVFICSLCGKEAGTIVLERGDDRIRGKRSSFVSELTCYLDLTLWSRLAEAVANGDAAALYAIDLELTPFYCPACRACFCGDHWQSGSIWDDGFHDSSRGACPNGHERMLED